MTAPAPGPGLGRRLVANTLHAASGRLAAVVVWLLVTPPILRALGPEGFAVWSLFFALTGYLSAFDLGIVQGTVRHVAAARERGAHDEAGAFATLGVLGFLALGAVGLLVMALVRAPLLTWLRIPPAGVDEAGFVVLAGVVVFVLAGIANVAMAVAQGCGRFDLANGVTLVLTAQQAIGVPVVLAAGWGLRGLVINVGLGWAVGALLGALALRRFVPEVRWRAPGDALAHAREAFRFGGPMQIANVLGVLHGQLDKFLLPRFVALAAVTPYELGSRVAISAATFPQLLLLATLPEAAALHAGEAPERLRALYDRGGRYVLTATAVVTAALLGSADRLYGTWLGPGHGEAALVMRALALTTAVSLATGMGTVIARGVGRTRLEAEFAAIAFGVHLVLSLGLIPRFGMTGALAAILAGNLVGAVVFLARLGGALGWSRAHLLLGPHAVPLAAVAVGTALGLALDRVLPTPAGAAAWALLAGVAGACALAALLVTTATRFFPWREARELLARRAAGA